MGIGFLIKFLNLKVAPKRSINETIKKDQVWDTLKITERLYPKCPDNWPFYGTIKSITALPSF